MKARNLTPEQLKKHVLDCRSLATDARFTDDGYIEIFGKTPTNPDKPKWYKWGLSDDKKCLTCGKDYGYIRSSMTNDA